MPTVRGNAPLTAAFFGCSFIDGDMTVRTGVFPSKTTSLTWPKGKKAREKRRDETEGQKDAARRDRRGARGSPRAQVLDGAATCPALAHHRCSNAARAAASLAAPRALGHRVKRLGRLRLS